MGEKSARVLRYLVPLRRLLRERRVDILHARSRLPAWLALSAWRSLPPARRPRFVTTFHGLYSVNRYSAVMARGAAVIAISDTVRDHIRYCYPWSKSGASWSYPEVWTLWIILTATIRHRTGG